MWKQKFSFPLTVMKIHVSTIWHFDMFNPRLMFNQTFEIVQPSCARCGKCLFSFTSDVPRQWMMLLKMILITKNDDVCLILQMISQVDAWCLSWWWWWWWWLIMFVWFYRWLDNDIEDSCCLRYRSIFAGGWVSPRTCYFVCFFLAWLEIDFQKKSHQMIFSCKCIDL